MIPWTDTTHREGNPGALKLPEGFPVTLEKVGFALHVWEPSAAAPRAKMGQDRAGNGGRQTGLGEGNAARQELRQERQQRGHTGTRNRLRDAFPPATAPGGEEAVREQNPLFQCGR